MRDTRKELADNEQKQNQPGKQDGEPESGDESDDPNARGKRSSDDADASKLDDPNVGENAWLVTLPAEIRDALAGGFYERIPARYRHLIRRYQLWLNKEAAKKSER